MKKSGTTWKTVGTTAKSVSAVHPHHMLVSISISFLVIIDAAEAVVAKAVVREHHINQE